MLNTPTRPLEPIILAELKSYLRITQSAEDATLTSLLESAIDICANFIGTPPILLEFSEDLAITGEWQNLSKMPVIMIESVTGLMGESSDFLFPSDSYAIDINEHARGRIRILRRGTAGHIRVIYQAGLSENWQGLASPLRSGIIRLAAHIYSNRNLDDGMQPPAAIAALWQPYRRMRLI